MKKTDCIIIGGGIIGMTTARELARRGLSVRLLDKGQVGQEASWAAGGILSSMRPWSENRHSAELSNQGKTNYKNFAATLQKETGIDPEYEQSGLLMINKADIAHTRKWAEKMQLRFSDCYTGTSKQLRIPASTLFLPEIAQIRVPRLLKALKASLLHYQIKLHEETPVTSLDSKQGKCKQLQAGTETYYADAFIITAGTWSQQLLMAHDQAITIKPVHGQMLCLKFPKKRLHIMVLDAGHYLIPRRDGHVLIGSTIENIGFQKKTTLAAKATLMNWARNLYPEIEMAEFVQHWSGLRPATTNGRPYIGKLEGYDNIFINAGHFRKGILQAPICAEKIATLVCQHLV